VFGVLKSKNTSENISVNVLWYLQAKNPAAQEKILLRRL